MQFLLNKKDREEINKLIDTYFYNNDIANLINEEIINSPFDNEDNDIIKINKLDINKYKNNLFYKNVTPKEVSFNNYKIKYEKYSANNCFMFDEIEIDSNDYYLISNKIGYFTEDFRYLTIQKDDVTWMSVIPHEINTMKLDSNKLTKHIYVLGLGLGYFPFINEDKVEKITIIEKDKTIIDLFNKHIFPFFNNKDKYEIINDDAFNYLKKININDFVFIDLWHDPIDGLEIYIKLLKETKDFSNVHFWIEKSLLQAYRNNLIVLLDEELNHKGEVDYSKSNSFNDELINSLHIKLKNKKISSYNDIKNLLTDKNIKDLIIN